LVEHLERWPAPALAQGNSGQLPGIWRNLHYEVTILRRDKWVQAVALNRRE
jgi:hypothetical protein